MATVSLRFFAAARAAAGTSETVVTIGDGATIGSVLAAAGEMETVSSGYAETVARCSFLVNAIASTDHQLLLRDGDRVDVLPPFAGG